MNTGKISWQAVRSLIRYRIRTLIMMSGILVSIGSLAVLSSLGEATKSDAMRRFKNMIGTFDSIIVRPGGGRTRGMPTLVNVPPTLRFEDARAIAREIPQIKAVAEVQNAFDIDIKYRDRAASPAIFGVSPNWLVLRSEVVVEGDFFTAEQNESVMRVAVIGRDVRIQLFPDEDPIGKTMRIADVPFEVIGLLKSRGAGPGGASLDNVVLIPINTASRRLFNRNFLTMLIAQVSDPDRSDETTNRVAALLRQRHRIQPSALDDFTITSPAVTAAQVARAGTTFQKTLTGISAMALLVGGIVIMGLMSIAVTERRREIGVRRSTGATRSDVVQQFLFEAIFVSLAGGIAGVILGLIGVRAVSGFQNLPQVIVWQTFELAVALSFTVGVLFGLYPAWRASRVDPVSALRS
jgi:putative ABC transport system permease protein